MLSCYCFPATVGALDKIGTEGRKDRVYDCGGEVCLQTARYKDSRGTRKEKCTSSLRNSGWREIFVRRRTNYPRFQSTSWHEE